MLKDREKMEDGTYRMQMTEEEFLSSSVEIFGYREGEALRDAGIHTVAELLETIKTRDWYRNVPGIGKRTAYRIECDIERCMEELVVESRL